MVTKQTENAKPDPDEEWAIGGKRVITLEGERPAAVLIRGEKIVAVLAPEALPAGCTYVDVADRIILPGLVDTHVHINEPGRTEWEGFTTATRAAAAGGITTLVDMPLNSSPVTTTLLAFRQKLEASQGKLWVDCGFYGGIVPGNADQIEALADAGVLGFKAFLCHSGIDEFPNVTEADLREAIPRIIAAGRNLPWGLPLLVHAELVGEAPSMSDPRSYREYLASRPRKWEHDAIELILSLAREFACPVHIVHLASADTLPLLEKAGAAGLLLTVETCPHYLYFAAEEIPDGDPRFKCAPPIREQENRDRLRRALCEGLIDTIGSDHSPAPPSLKQLDTGNLQAAWGGIASLQLSLPIMWTMARGWPGISLVDIVQWMSSCPAVMVGLFKRKGSISPGCDADLVVFDPDAEFTVDATRLEHRHKVTPYDGHQLFGRVEQTYLRGRKIFDAGKFEEMPTGLPLLHPRHEGSGS